HCPRPDQIGRLTKIDYKGKVRTGAPTPPSATLGQVRFVCGYSSVSRTKENLMAHLNPDDVKRLYESLAGKHEEAHRKFGRTHALAEKVLVSHLDRWPVRLPVRGETTEFLRPDRVAMQDATAQMALLQFMQGQFKTVAVPSTVHCD